MSFDRAKPAGWTPGQKLTATQINTIDTNLTKAIDGDGGGPYSPSSAIVITGSLECDDLKTSTAASDGEHVINKDYLEGSAGIEYGTYVPTISVQQNVTSTSVLQARYYRIGTQVTVYAGTTHQAQAPTISGVISTMTSESNFWQYLSRLLHQRRCLTSGR